MDSEIQSTKTVALGWANEPLTPRAPRAAEPLSAVMAQCAAEFHRSGVLAALEFLNGRTRFRYTGVYHAEPPILRNVHLFDRENPRLNVSGDVAQLDETYCGITRTTNAPFATSNALHDARLRTHAARESVLSYSGVPIRVDNLGPWGSLCHFDVRPRLLSPTELHILQAAAPLFARWLADTGA